MKNWNWYAAILFVGGYFWAHVGILIAGVPEFWFMPFIVSIAALPLIAWFFKDDPRQPT